LRRRSAVDFGPDPRRCLPPSVARVACRRLEAVPDPRFKKPDGLPACPLLEGTIALQATVTPLPRGALRHLPILRVSWLTWKWKVPSLNAGRQHAGHVEDLPAVIVVRGRARQAAPAEQINYDLAKAIAGNELPYATLMYIWENHLPEGEIITHHFTTRIKMIVAAGGRKDLGSWQEERVNLREDYRRAFGEEPPRVRAVGIMSDSDNGGAHRRLVRRHPFERAKAATSSPSRGAPPPRAVGRGRQATARSVDGACSRCRSANFAKLGIGLRTRKTESFTSFERPRPHPWPLWLDLGEEAPAASSVEKTPRRWRRDGWTGR
jgi:hypothetical protein